MKHIVYSILFAVVCFAIAKVIDRLSKESNEKISSHGIVKGIVKENDGWWKYWISLLIDGEEYVGHTGMYAPSSPRLKEGDEVRIKYHFTPTGELWIDVDDIKMDDGSALAKKVSGMLKVVSILLMLLAIILIYKNFS